MIYLLWIQPLLSFSRWLQFTYLIISDKQNQGYKCVFLLSKVSYYIIIEGLQFRNSHIRKMFIPSEESSPDSHRQKIKETKDLIINWFSMSREDRKKFDWQQKSSNMYNFLFPLIFDDFNLQQSLIPEICMIEKFSKFVSIAFRVKNLYDCQQIFNLNQVFLLSLDHELVVSEFSKNSLKNRSMKKLNCNLSYNENSGMVSISKWQKIDFYTNLIKIKAVEGHGLLAYADKAITNKFKFQIMKQDFEIKSNFLKAYLFSTKCMNLSINSFSVKRMKRGENLKPMQEKLYLIYEGSVIQQITVKGMNSKRKFQLVKGGIISKNSFKQFLNNNYVCETGKMQNSGSTYYLVTESILLEISFHELMKVVKQDKGMKKKMTERLNEIENAQLEIASRSVNAEILLKQADNKITELHYSMPRSKTSKAFRRKTQPKQSLEFHESQYEQFITFDRYEKMTQNKVNVQKKHLIFCELNNLLRQKQKEERFIKKMNTIKGMKEIKKCEYQARLKKSKIQNLAIKDSIMNAEKFRDKPHQIKFIFEQEIIEKLVKTQVDNHVLTNKKFVSMLQLAEDNQKELLQHHTFQSISNSKQMIIATKSPPIPKTISRFYKHKSVKILDNESKKSILQNSEMKSNTKFGTSENIKQQQFQCV